MTQNAQPAYPTIATILALIGGTIILLGGLMFVAASVFVLPNLTYANVAVPAGLPATSLPGLISGFVGVMGAFGLVSGAIVLLSSVMILANSGQRRTWSVLILVFSLVSFIGFGGFIVGAVLGIVGGALALRWSPPTL